MVSLFFILLIIFSKSTFVWIVDGISPLINAIILSYLLDSLVRFFVEKLKVRRVQGVLISCLLLLGTVAVLIYSVLPTINDNINAIVAFVINGEFDVIDIITGMKDKFDYGFVHYIADALLQAGELIQSKMNSIVFQISNSLMKIIANIGSGAFTTITSFIIAIYMLLEKDDLLARARRFILALFEEKTCNKILNVFNMANKIFSSFISGKMLDSFIVGLMCVTAFTIFSIPYALLMGTIIGIFNLLPYFGPVIGSIPVIVVSFLVNPTKAITSLVIIIIIQQIDANFIDPRIVGKNVGVSPFWIVTAVTIGGNLFGFMGLLLSVPIVVLFKTIMEEFVNMRLIEKNMCDYEQCNIKEIK